MGLKDFKDYFLSPSSLLQSASFTLLQALITGQPFVTLHFTISLFLLGVTDLLAVISKGFKRLVLSSFSNKKEKTV